MTEREALRLALSTLDEVRSETFRLLRNGQKLYAEEKVWKTVFAIKQVLAKPEDPCKEANYSQTSEQEPVGFAGVKIWIGSQQVVRILTQTELHHAVEPWLLVGLNAEMCIKKLKENT